MKKEKRIPTIIGLIFLLASLAVGIYLTGSKTNLSSKASGDCNPVNVQISNVTNNSADISFITTSVCLSNVSINNQMIEDVRFLNTSQVPSAIRIHYFQVKSLKELTEYRFSLISGGQNISNDSYRFTTSSKPKSQIPTSNLAWGRILDPDQKPTSNAIVYLNIPGSAPLSSFVTSNGNWSISLASSFNESKNDWFVPPPTSIEEEIIVISDDGNSTQITNNTGTNNPVPDIIIGQNSFSSPPDPTPPDVGQINNFNPVQTQKNVDILNPKDGENIQVVKPDFFGTAPINSKVIIEVHSPVPVNGEAQSDVSGTWHWSPPQDLTPGEHTITVKVQNPTTGLWESITRNFTVMATDNGNPAYEASASASKITPSLIPTATIIPTDIPFPTERVARPSTTAKPPVTGDTYPTIIIIGLSLLFFIISIKFIL
jgi:hypothetical protein